MKVSNLVGERFKETPSECVIASHIFMLRGGYVKYVANGIYSQLTPMKRVTQKIERIIRQEMDAVGAQEVLFPVALPGALWEESGRYASVGKELLRFTDRNGNQMVLGMTHEEAAVHLAREYGATYQRYPFAIYQIQTKFRDEARPRGGLIRVREFTMKDAYSFHTSQEDLKAHYMRFHKAYERIYRRVGLPDVVSVASDSGMMGGSLSHEFMYLTPAGEDSIALCRNCDYRANVEAAENIVKNTAERSDPLTLTETPGIKTIEALCGFLSVKADETCKAVVYRQGAQDRYVVLFLRGDMEANETKLANYLGDEVYPAVLEEGSGLTAGSIGPYGLNPDCAVLYDSSLRGAGSLVCGANQEGYHYTGLCLERDCGEIEYRDFGKVSEGSICPACGEASISISRGIEVGNIFQLGDKYTKAMNMRYIDRNGETRHPVMGCYGIGVGRLAASVCEAHHDQNGPVWPMSIAPWQVELCCIRVDQPDVAEAAERLYAGLQKAGVEVLCDDREVSAGVMFSDADLFGSPLRVIVSPRNLKEGSVEIVARDGSRRDIVPVEDALAYIIHRISDCI